MMNTEIFSIPLESLFFMFREIHRITLDYSSEGDSSQLLNDLSIKIKHF